MLAFWWGFDCDNHVTTERKRKFAERWPFFYNLIWPLKVPMTWKFSLVFMIVFARTVKIMKNGFYSSFIGSRVLELLRLDGLFHFGSLQVFLFCFKLSCCIKTHTETMLKNSNVTLHLGENKERFWRKRGTWKLICCYGNHVSNIVISLVDWVSLQSLSQFGPINQRYAWFAVLLQYHVQLVRSSLKLYKA